MGSIIITRPTAAARAFVEALASNTTSPIIAHLLEVSKKDVLTECEGDWFKYELSQYLIEHVPA